MTKTRKNTAVPFLARFSLLALVGAGLYLYFLTLPVSRQTSSQEFIVQTGQSAQSIAKNLHSNRLIRSPLYFRLFVRIKSLTLQAGYYQLSPHQSVSDIAHSLTRGLAKSTKLTIPEGYRAEQIALAAGLPLPDFLAAAKGLEGQLFPDTYFLKEGITAPELVKLMHDNFLQKAGSVDSSTLILASLIERETKGDAEKPLVSGILHKRLANDWPLELDATVQYIKGSARDWWPQTSLSDRQLPSRYNTYLHPGLPPSPICNPGLASLKAAASPEDSPYWFYLHDREGVIRYAKTNAEHTQNIQTYLY